MNITATNIQDEVKKQAEEHGLNLSTNDGYNRAFALARMKRPELFATNSSQSHSQPTAAARLASVNRRVNAVKAQADRLGLDITRNDDYNQAYRAAKNHNPALFAANDGPANVTTSQDGQKLNGGWPAPPEKLKALGLPLSATQEQFQLYLTADETKLTPELAAVVARDLIQFSQLNRALSFDEALSYVKEHRPEIYKLAIQATRIK